MTLTLCPYWEKYREPKLYGAGDFKHNCGSCVGAGFNNNKLNRWLRCQPAKTTDNPSGHFELAVSASSTEAHFQGKNIQRTVLENIIQQYFIVF